MRLLKHIQSRPSDVKARYALFAASVTTGIIALIWVTTLPSRFASTVPLADGESEGGGTEELKELFDETKSQLGNVINWEEPAKGPEVETANLDTLSTEEGAEVEAKDAPTETPEEAPRVILIGTTTPQGTD